MSNLSKNPCIAKILRNNHRKTNLLPEFQFSLRLLKFLTLNNRYIVITIPENVLVCLCDSVSCFWQGLFFTSPLSTIDSNLTSFSCAAWKMRTKFRCIILYMLVVAQPHNSMRNKFERVSFKVVFRQTKVCSNGDNDLTSNFSKAVKEDEGK